MINDDVYNSDLTKNELDIDKLQLNKDVLKQYGFVYATETMPERKWALRPIHTLGVVDNREELKLDAKKLFERVEKIANKLHGMQRFGIVDSTPNAMNGNPEFSFTFTDVYNDSPVTFAGLIKKAKDYRSTEYNYPGFGRLQYIFTLLYEDQDKDVQAKVYNTEDQPDKASTYRNGRTIRVFNNNHEIVKEHTYSTASNANRAIKAINNEPDTNIVLNEKEL